MITRTWKGNHWCSSVTNTKIFSDWITPSFVSIKKKKTKALQDGTDLSSNMNSEKRQKKSK
jgi:hypothetical protein